VEAIMGICFIIQPFDGGPFDKRYKDVFVPAVTAAELEPYRVDRDPAVSIPIDEIESGIKKAEACLADVSTMNPNVWFELGFAIASGKDVVLVCSFDPARKFPFDIQHRSIITYRTESPSDFEDLKIKITNRLKAIISKEEKLGKVAELPPIAEIEGLAQHEMATLVTLGANIDNPGDRVAVVTIRDDMLRAGYTKIAVTLSLTALLRKEMLEAYEDHDWNGNPYTVYSLTEKGMNWLLHNQDRLILYVKKPVKNETKIEDDIPF
jgi:hypothetical protein